MPAAVNARSTIFDPAIYRRFELRERPFINTTWRLVLNQRDDVNNQDIDLNGLADVLIYVYYRDFTEPAGCRG